MVVLAATCPAGGEGSSSWCGECRWAGADPAAIGSGLITRRGRWRSGGWQGRRCRRSGRSGLQDAASPSVGKRDSRFCDPCDPASCCNARVSCGSDEAGCPAGSASCGFCPCHTPIPHHRGRRRQALAHHTSTGKVTALPLTQVEPQGTTFAVADPMELAGQAPLGPTNQAGAPPLVEAGHRGMDFDVSGVNHQHLWLCGVGWLWGIHPAQPLLKDRDDAAQHPPVLHPLPTPFLGEQGADAINLLRPESKQLGHHRSPHWCPLGGLSLVRGSFLT